MKTNTHLRLVSDSTRVQHGAPPQEKVGLTIDCNECAMQHSEACDDCMVSYLVGHVEGTPVVLDFEERRACELLSDVGLVPSNRFVARAGAV
ncbi:MAG: hypothetical protein KTU85_11090 [Acidimicrobiia bacterium]|nr:hypothetical protein [Acidimicrobiia bacterium]MCY4457931.1 hypothetical protein [Acidimicrobiaceae bacterium]